jgi:hypothetical protein
MSLKKFCLKDYYVLTGGKITTKTTNARKKKKKNVKAPKKYVQRLASRPKCANFAQKL